MVAKLLVLILLLLRYPPKRYWRSARAHKVLRRHSEDRRALLLVNLALRPKQRIAGELAEALSAAEEDGRIESFGEEEREDDEGEGRDPEELVDGPPPAILLRCKASLQLQISQRCLEKGK